MTKVIVGIPNYNKGKYLKEAIDSVLNQTFQDFILYVFDNCSTDNSKEVMLEYKDNEKVKLVFHEENIGGTGNWNACLTTDTKSEYVAILHADDKWYPNHLENAVIQLDTSPHCGLYYCPCVWIDGDSNELGVVNHVGHRYDQYAGYRNEFAELLVYDSYLTPSAIVYRRESLDKVGHFINVKSGDWEHNLRFADKHGHFLFLPMPTCAYRKSDDQQSTEYYASPDPLIVHLTFLLDFLYYGDKTKILGYERKIRELLISRANQYPEYAYGLLWYINRAIEMLSENEAKLC